MSGQGKTTLALAKQMRDAGWTVVYVCIPNTPHVKVVAIPTIEGTSKQRYPDIFAYKGNITKIVEVEIQINEKVAKDITTRFQEHLISLGDPVRWQSYREQIFRITGHQLPMIFTPDCDLILCKPIRLSQRQYVANVESAGITVTAFSI